MVNVDVSVLGGTIDAASQDVYDLGQQPVGLPRHSEHVTATRTVPFHALSLVRRR